MDKKELKHLRSRTRHEFLLTLLPPYPHYATQEMNGYILVKQLNGQKEWEVAIYTKENWRKVEMWKRDREAQSEAQPIA